MNKLKPWDGTTPVYSQTCEKFFYDINEVADEYNDSLPDGAPTVAIPSDEYLVSLELYHAVPCQPPMLDTEYLCEYLPEDTSAEGDADDIIDEANKKMIECFKRHKIIECSDVRAIYTALCQTMREIDSRKQGGES